jgi:hypothetical protein
MINMIGQYLIFLTLILIGPPIAAMLVIVVLVIDLVTALALRHSFRRRTVALLGMLGLMVGNSLVLVLDRTDLDDLLEQSASHLSNSPLGPYSTLETVNLAIALVGIFASLRISFDQLLETPPHFEGVPRTKTT